MNDLGVSSDRILPLKIENLEPVADRPDALDADLIGFFNEEAAEQIAKVEKLLLKWETGETPEAWREMRVCFHTMKGAANSIGHVRIGALADGMDELFKGLNPAQALVKRATVIKSCILSLEAIKSLILESANPQFNKVRSGLVVAAAHAIIDAKQSDQLQGAA